MFFSYFVNNACKNLSYLMYADDITIYIVLLLKTSFTVTILKID